jgi:hypothetical protein
MPNWQIACPNNPLIATAATTIGTTAIQLSKDKLTVTSSTIADWRESTHNIDYRVKVAPNTSLTDNA